MRRHVARRGAPQPPAGRADGARNRRRRSWPVSSRPAQARTASAHPAVPSRMEHACPAAEAADATARHRRTAPAHRAPRALRKEDAEARADVPAWPAAPALPVRPGVSAACRRPAVTEAWTCLPRRDGVERAARAGPRVSWERLPEKGPSGEASGRAPPLRFHRSAAPWRTEKRHRHRPEREHRPPASARKRKFPASPASCPLFLKQWTCCSYRLS